MEGIEDDTQNHMGHEIYEDMNGDENDMDGDDQYDDEDDDDNM